LSATEPNTFDPAAITFRPATTEDDAFLFKVYAGTREDEMAQTGWLPIQQRAFLRMQFDLQKNSYADQFPQADHVIILLAGEPIGRMMVDRTRPDEMRGVDIALLPESRCRGVGRFLIRSLLEEASAAGKPFRIQVEKHNWRGLRLYDRLGFSKTGESDTHIAMEWLPSKTLK
jgi:ribosomal protein S18 acetylase RimI-like enzyme